MDPITPTLFIIRGIWNAIPTKVKIGIAIILICGGVYLYIQWLQNQKADLEADIAKVERELADKQVVLDEFSSQLKIEIEKQKMIQEQMNILQQRYDENRQGILVLQEKFGKHDLNKLATAKPKLVEKVINQATQKAFEDLNQIGDLK